MKIKKSQLMKLIRESLGSNRLLLERKTDEVYRKFVDFVYNEIVLKAVDVMRVGGVCVSMYDWEDPIDPSPKAARLIKKTRRYYGGNNVNFPGLFFEMPSKSEKQIYYDLFDTYQLKYIRGLDDVIFDDDKETFRYFMSGFTVTIVAYSRKGNAAGTMTSTGDLSVFYRPNLRNELTPKSNMATPEQFTYKSLEYVAENDSLDLLEAGQPLQGFVVKNAEDIKRLLEHELVHFANAIRSGGRDYRAKGGDKQFDVSAQEYVDSTEEMQARLIPAQNKFLSEPMTTNLEGSEYLTPKGEMMRDIKNADRQSFILKFLSNYYNTYNNARFDFENHSEANKQRLMNRSFEFLQEVQKSQDYRDFIKNNYDKLPSESEFQPPFPDFD
jgi:hypothetical protein